MTKTPTHEKLRRTSRWIAALSIVAAAVAVGACNDIDTEDDGDEVPTTIAVSSSQCQSCLIKQGKLWCWGDSFGGDDVTGGAPREVALPGYPILVTVAPDHACALVKDEGVYCWGQNDAGQLGVAIPMDPGETIKQPQKSGLSSTATALTSGAGFTCAIVSNVVKCMGGNIDGTLGNGDFSRSVDPVGVPGLSSIKEIGSGYAHTCALDDIGDVYCWGANDNGQSGQDKNDGQTLDHAVKVMIPRATKLMIGWETSCAFTDDGLYCWGRNNSGQFGDMAPNDGLPRKIALDGYVDIKPGASRTFALAQDGTADYWGLELSQMGEPVAPTKILGVNNISLISAGSNHGCGVTGGSVFCWGDNTCHQLGGAPGNISAVPVKINVP